MTFDLASLGWDVSFAAAYRRVAARWLPDGARSGLPDGRSGCVPGRVARVDRGVCTVLTAAGTVRASVAGAVLAATGGDPEALPCAGDWLAVRTWPDGRITAEAVLPRRSAVVRRTAGKDASGQVLAANIDTAAVVEPLDPAPDLGRVERLLALAWQSGAQPLVVLTKADLAPDPDAIALQVADVAPGVAVLPISAERGTGLDALHPRVAPGLTCALLGRSGSGKSTLVNALVGAPVMGTQQVRRVDGKGRHTTAYRALVPLPGGGAVVDTPGLRAAGLIDGAHGLDQAFADVRALAAGCRFTDCAHGTEPGCEVRAALESGALSLRRLAHWRKLQRELAHHARRRGARVPPR